MSACHPRIFSLPVRTAAERHDRRPRRHAQAHPPPRHPRRARREDRPLRRLRDARPVRRGHHRRAQGRARALRHVRRLAHGRVLDHAANAPSISSTTSRRTTSPRSPSARCTTPRSSTTAARSRTTASSIASPTSIMMVVNASATSPRTSRTSRGTRRKFGVTIEDVERRHGAPRACRGRRRAEILQALTATDLSTIKYYHFAEGEVAGMPTIISRTGYTGEDGFELYIANDSAVPLWNALMATGRVTPARTRRARHAAPRDGDGALRQRHRRHRHAARGEPRLAREAEEGRLRRHAMRSSRRRSSGVPKKLVGFTMARAQLPASRLPGVLRRRSRAATCAAAR